MTLRRPLALIPLALLPVALLLGCAPGAPSVSPSTAVAEPVGGSPDSPSPSPTSEPTSEPDGTPDLADLVVSPDGLGPLVIGQPIDPAVATFDPQGCRTEENQDVLPEGDPGWAAYLPNYAKQPVDVLGYTYDLYPFEPHHSEDGSLWWLRIRSGDLRTAEGIGLGSGVDDLLAAYPDAQLYDFGGSDVYVIADEDSRLVFEVAGDDSLGAPIGTVWDVRVEPLDWEPMSIAFGDGGAFCAIGV
jgi:hypothetical protein